VVDHAHIQMHDTARRHTLADCSAPVRLPRARRCITDHTHGAVSGSTAGSGPKDASAAATGMMPPPPAPFALSKLLGAMASPRWQSARRAESVSPFGISIGEPAGKVKC
jgi:hypothetical protein